MSTCTEAPGAAEFRCSVMPCSTPETVLLAEVTGTPSTDSVASAPSDAFTQPSPAVSELMVTSEADPVASPNTLRRAPRLSVITAACTPIPRALMDCAMSVSVSCPLVKETVTGDCEPTCNLKLPAPPNEALADVCSAV